MTEFDPDKFEEKYVHYFEELEEAYSNAYNQLHGRYDSEVLRAIDRQVLSESEPFYEGSAEPRRGNSERSQPSEDDVFRDTADESSGQSPRDHDGEFRVELPDDARARAGAVADHDQFDVVLEEFVDRIERELQRIFDVDPDA